MKKHQVVYDINTDPEATIAARTDIRRQGLPFSNDKKGTLDIYVRETQTLLPETKVVKTTDIKRW